MATYTIKRVQGILRSLTRLQLIIAINVAIFVVLLVAGAIMRISGHPGAMNTMLSYVELPSRLGILITRPWSVLTYMFCHTDITHIIFNMLWLYWFGTILTRMRPSTDILRIYLAGGFGGAALYLIALNIIPSLAAPGGSWLLGASAAILAIVTLTAMLFPHYYLNLILIGRVKLVWVAVATIVLDLIGISAGNTGGHVAHIGGILTGALYALSILHPQQMTKLKSFFRRRSPDAPRRPKADNSDLDQILLKIKRSGYTSLTPAERDRLFNSSRR